MARAKIDFPFAAIPLEAIGDPELPPAAFELFCLLCKLAFLERDFTLSDIASTLAKQADGDAPKPPGRRSIYRWLTAVEAAGWLSWERHGGESDRFTIHSHKVPLVTHVSPVAHQSVTSGTPHVPPGSHADRGLPHPNAASDRAKTPDQTPEDSGGGGGSAQARNVKHSTPRLTEPPTPSPGERLLASEGFGDTACRLFGSYPADVLAADIARLRAGGAGNGAIVLAWKRVPPGTASPSIAPTDDPPKERTDAPRRPRGGVGPGRGRVPAVAAEPAPHLSHGVETADDVERAIAEGLAAGEAYAHRRGS